MRLMFGDGIKNGLTQIGQFALTDAMHLGNHPTWLKLGVTMHTFMGFIDSPFR